MMSNKSKALMTPLFLGHKVGILGGGQLARMLSQAGQRLGLEMHVLSSEINDPAAQVTSHWHEGHATNTKDLIAFFKQVDVVVIESEFLDSSVLNIALSQSEVIMAPKPELIATFSDRLKQKEWLTRSHIPTAPYACFNSPDDILLFAKLNKDKIVIKKRRFGYDGYGTFILKTPAAIKSWLERHRDSLEEYVAEFFIHFRRELAQQIALNARGDVCTFPLVEWRAQDAKCLWVKGPAQDPRAKPLAAQMARALRRAKYEGLLAFEMFDGRSGLLVNEVAPRVHNSAHYSLEGLSLDQFTAHLLAALNLPLPKAPHENGYGFAMYNLLGTANQPPQLQLPILGAHFHWYGKKENRQGRKMGHLTSISTKSPEDALRTVLKSQKRISL